MLTRTYRRTMVVSTIVLLLLKAHFCGFAETNANPKRNTQNPKVTKNISAAKSYPNRHLGDKALAAGQYEQAAAFYIKYKKNAAKDIEALKNSIDCLLAAYVKAAKPKLVEKELNEYKKLASTVTEKTRLFLYQIELDLLRGNFSNAEIALDAWLKEATPQKNALYFQALSAMTFACSRQEKWEKALEFYAKLDNLEKNARFEPQIWKWRILALVKAGKHLEAETQIKSFLKREPNQSETLKFLSLILLAKTKQNKEALQLYESLEPNETKTDPIISFIAFQDLAELFLEGKKYETAIPILDKAFAIAPCANNRQCILLKIIDVNMLLKKYQLAIAACSRYLKYYEKNPSSLKVKLLLAKSRECLNEKQAALLIYDELLQSDASPVLKTKAAAAAAKILSEQKRYSEALAKHEYILKNAISEDLKGEAAFRIAELSLINRNYEVAAKKFLDIAISYKNWRKESIFNAVISFIKLKNYKDATFWAKVFLKEYPSGEKRKQIIFYHALAKQMNGDLSQARVEFIDFAKKYPNHPLAANALYESGNIAYSKCNFAEAIAGFNLFIQKYPTSKELPRAIYHRLVARYFEGDVENALKDADDLAIKYPKSKYAIGALFWKVDYHVSLGELEKALSLLDHIFNRYQAQADVGAKSLYDQAYIAKLSTKPDLALKKIQQLLGKYPEHNRVSEALFLNGDILTAKNDFLNALDFYEKAAARRPNSSLEIACWGRIGDCYFSLYPADLNQEKLNKAEVYYKKILESKDIEPLFRAQTLYKIAKTYEFLKKTELAAANYREVIYRSELDIDAPGQRLWLVKSAFALADLHLEENSPEAARKALKIYKNLIQRKIAPGEECQNKIKVIRKQYGI